MLHFCIDLNRYGLIWCFAYNKLWINLLGLLIGSRISDNLVLRARVARYVFVCTKTYLQGGDDPRLIPRLNCIKFKQINSITFFKSFPMARPKISDSRNALNKRLPAIRCTAEEVSTIKQKANQAGLSVSEYIRQCATNQKIAAAKTSKIDENFELVFQLKRVGVNVNQIAKNMNIFKHPPTSDHMRVWQKLEQVLDQLVIAM